VNDRGPTTEVPVVKDASKQGPIPSAWRPVFRDIVKAFVRGDFNVSTGVLGVSPVRDNVAQQMEAYVKVYGETLVELPDEAWDSSVCIWTGERWDTIVDLWTRREGRSDLILQTLVRESAEGFSYDIGMVYVP
jgi:hypothetical protein